MKISLFLPVVTLREKKMPFYLSSIGTAVYQTVVHRPFGIEDHQLLYTVKGGGEVFFGGRWYDAARGTMLFLPAGCPHEYHATTDDWQTLYLTFNGSGVRGFFDFDPWMMRIDDKMDFEQCHSKLYEYKQNPTMDNKLSVYMYSVLLELKDCMEYHTAISNRQRDIVTDAIHGLVQKNSFVLGDIAKQYGISEEHFCRMFKKHTGYRPFEYVNLVRIQNAKELLVYTDMSVAEISAQCGYESHSYFSMLFKKYVGDTPSHYRSTIRGGCVL